MLRGLRWFGGCLLGGSGILAITGHPALVHFSVGPQGVWVASNFTTAVLVIGAVCLGIGVWRQRGRQKNATPGR